MDSVLFIPTKRGAKLDECISIPVTRQWIHRNKPIYICDVSATRLLKDTFIPTLTIWFQQKDSLKELHHCATGSNSYAEVPINPFWPSCNFLEERHLIYDGLHEIIMLDNNTTASQRIKLLFYKRYIIGGISGGYFTDVCTGVTSAEKHI
jgi:hypothetical protein